MILLRAAACLVALLPGLAQAGRPLVTDDASLTAARACQVESWQQSTVAGREFWLLPACNPTGRLEITAGGVRRWRDQAEDDTAYTVQAKTLLREIAPGGAGFDYGLGLAAGVVRGGVEGLDSDYAYLPLTLLFAEGVVAVHANAGWVHDRSDRSEAFSYGLGTQVSLPRGISPFIEIYGDDAGDPTAHAGLTLIALPDRLHVDASYGRVLGRAANSFLTFGINVYLPPF